MLKINGNTGISGDSKGLNVGLRLHKHPCFVYASSANDAKSTEIRASTVHLQLGSREFIITCA